MLNIANSHMTVCLSDYGSWPLPIYWNCFDYDPVIISWLFRCCGSFYLIFTPWFSALLSMPIVFYSGMM